MHFSMIFIHYFSRRFPRSDRQLIEDYYLGSWVNFFGFIRNFAMTSSICHTAIFFLDTIYEKFIDSALSVQISGLGSSNVLMFGPNRTKTIEIVPKPHFQTLSNLKNHFVCLINTRTGTLKQMLAIKMICFFSIISMIFGWVPAVLVAVFPYISQGRVPRTGRKFD